MRMSYAHLIIGGNQQTRKKKVLELYLEIKPNRKPENDPDTQFLETQTSIKIEDIRILGRLLSLQPYHQPPKIALIPEAAKLTFEAQGSLLKLLEEPPGQTIFILATSHADNLLPTIISRCQVINLPPLSEIELSLEEIKTHQTTLKKILKASPGERIRLIEKITSREEAEKFCQIQLVLWREALLEDPNLEYVWIIHEIQKTRRYLSANVNPRLALENLLLSYPQNS